MKRTPLKRKTPLRAKKPFWLRSKKQKASSKKAMFVVKPRSTLRKVSKKKSRSIYTRYLPARAEFLKANPLCLICVCRGLIPPNTATEVHHLRGRAGSLLWDQRFFVASCRACREYPHENPKWAREVGILAPTREWNVVPRP